MDLSLLQQRIHDQRKHLSPKSMDQRFYYLIQEVGEVAEQLHKLTWMEDEAEREKVRVELGDELYDVVWNLLDLADIVGVDLQEAFERKHVYNEKRWKKGDPEPGGSGEKG